MLLNCGVLESPLDHKEIKPVNPKGNQSSLFITTLNVHLTVTFLITDVGEDSSESLGQQGDQTSKF